MFYFLWQKKIKLIFVSFWWQTNVIIGKEKRSLKPVISISFSAYILSCRNLKQNGNLSNIILILCVLNVSYQLIYFIFLLFSGNCITQLIRLWRNGERRQFRNLSAATGFTMCGHQPAVILAKLLFCRWALQHFLLRRTLYPVFHSQWPCVSFPICVGPVLWPPVLSAAWNSIGDVE